jgi:hypothetical protein
MRIKEAMVGHIVATVCEAIVLEGRKDPEKLRNRKQGTEQPLLFSRPEEPEPERTSCPITPLSGYKTHISAIQSFAMASPENLAQTMMFSPLSANVGFSKHWDNFHVLMMVLKHYFPKHVDYDELRAVLDGFSEYLHSLKMTIGGWKLDTIVYIWNNREKLFHELPALSKEGDDVKLISRLVQIPGVQPVKAGFIAQLLFGKAGCIDTHNIDIYSKVFPDLRGELNPKDWQNRETGPATYMKILNKLQDRGVGSQQLWDVWVDFVENFYKTTSPSGLGTYAPMGSSLDPNDPIYKAFANVKIPKQRVGRAKDHQFVDIPVISGKHGMGASATHLQNDPEEMLRQFRRMYTLGEPGTDAAKAIPFYTTSKGLPLDPTSGLGAKPSLLHYFEPALSRSGEIDSDRVKDIIAKRVQTAKERALAKANRISAQQQLFSAA